MKISFITLLLLLSLQHLLKGQSANTLLQEGLQLEQQAKEAAALKNYQLVLQQDSSNVVALNHAAILMAREGKRQTKVKSAEPYFLTAKNYASRALRVHAEDKVSLVALSMALQQLSLHAGAKEKAAYIKEIKTYLDKAIQIDSAYGPAWHLLGDWNIEVSQMNFAEKAATKLLFGGLPEAGMDAAIAAYARCRRLEPASIENYFDLARAYHTQGNDTQAMAMLKQAIRLRPVAQDDRAIQQQCKDMLQSLQ